jgi:hypothetical protein
MMSLLGAKSNERRHNYMSVMRAARAAAVGGNLPLAERRSNLLNRA